MNEEDQLRFGFDLLDPTKIVPEDIVPFTPLGKLTLNRNPRNYFAETEQIMVSNLTSNGASIADMLQVSSGPYCQRHRFHGGSTDARTYLFLHGYPTQSS